jgi:hypothetical protein
LSGVRDFPAGASLGKIPKNRFKCDLSRGFDVLEGKNGRPCPQRMILGEIKKVFYGKNTATEAHGFE